MNGLLEIDASKKAMHHEVMSHRWSEACNAYKGSLSKLVRLDTERSGNPFIIRSSRAISSGEGCGSYTSSVYGCDTSWQRWLRPDVPHLQSVGASHLDNKFYCMKYCVFVDLMFWAFVARVSGGSSSDMRRGEFWISQWLDIYCYWRTWRGMAWWLHGLVYVEVIVYICSGVSFCGLKCCFHSLSSCMCLYIVVFCHRNCSMSMIQYVLHMAIFCHIFCITDDHDAIVYHSIVCLQYGLPMALFYHIFLHRKWSRPLYCIWLYNMMITSYLSGYDWQLHMFQIGLIVLVFWLYLCKTLLISIMYFGLCGNVYNILLWLPVINCGINTCPSNH